MKQHVQGAGVRQWYGDDLLELQSENLDVLQGFFGEFGPFILQGCDVVANGSNWDISAGLACINHADGWKIVRVEAVVNTTLPGYFTVGKQTVSGDYDSGTGTVAYRYHADNAQFTTGSTTAADTKLIIPDPASADPVRFKDALDLLYNYVYDGTGIAFATVGSTTWANFGSVFGITLNDAEYRIAGNTANLCGAVVGDVTVGNVNVLTLPVAARPAIECRVPCIMLASSTYIATHLIIKTSGVVQVVSGVADSGVTLFLDGVTYRMY